MTTQIHKYQRATTRGPNGATLYFRNSEDEPRATELCEIDGWWYVSVPEGCVLPDQWPECEFQAVTLTPELREQIKAQARPCQLIAQRMVETIRAQYSIDDEMYFARIGVGAANGMYVPTADETAEMQAFGAFVESVRQWGRDERAKLGL